MSSLTVVAKVVAKKESVEELRSELLKLLAPTRSEEGCINYTLHQDNEDPVVFIFYETWASPAHLERHMASDHFRVYAKATEGLVADRAVHKLTEMGTFTTT
jgi:quinol monooxygenase YgiN